MIQYIKRSLGKSKIRFSLSVALCFAVGISFFMCFVALNHNPQQEYSSNFISLIFIFIIWFLAIFGSFLSIFLIIGFIKGLKNKNIF